MSPLAQLRRQNTVALSPQYGGTLKVPEAQSSIWLKPLLELGAVLTHPTYPADPAAGVGKVHTVHGV